MTDQNKQQAMWGEPDSERLSHYDSDECIESIIDEAHGVVPIEELGEITVEEYRPREVKPADCGDVLEMVLSQLDEEFGDPEGDPTDSTPAMDKAAEAFLAAVIAEYVPWSHLPTGKTVTVNALEWVRNNRPDWLEKP